jgi:hypothetical protein
MCLHADSLFTSLGGAWGSCPVCSSSISAIAAVTVENCIIEKAIPAPDSRYIRSHEAGSVRMVGNTFDTTTGMFEVYEPGTLSA